MVLVPSEPARRRGNYVGRLQPWKDWEAHATHTHTHTLARQGLFPSGQCARYVPSVPVDILHAGLGGDDFRQTYITQRQLAAHHNDLGIMIDHVCMMRREAH